jgi:hypothetical protein
MLAEMADGWFGRFQKYFRQERHRSQHEIVAAIRTE